MPVYCYFNVPKLEEDKQIEESLLLANQDKSLKDSSSSSNRSSVNMVIPAPVSDPYLSMVPVR